MTTPVNETFRIASVGMWEVPEKFSANLGRWLIPVSEHLCLGDFTRENSENCPCWGWCQEPFLMYWGGFLLKLSQYMSKYWLYGIELFSFLSRPRGGHLEGPCPPGFPDKNKLGIWHPRDLKPPPFMPVKYRDLISVPHLGSRTQPCWATRCTSWGRTWSTTAGC